MYRTTLLLIAGLVALGIAACEPNDEGVVPDSLVDVSMDLFASASPSPLEIAPSPSSSPSLSPSPSASASPEPVGEASLGTDDGIGLDEACRDAFSDVPSVAAIESLGGLHDMVDTLDATILACGSVEHWREEAEAIGLDDLDVDAEEFLSVRCDQNVELRLTPICREL